MRTTKTAVIAALAALTVGGVWADYASDCKAAAKRKRTVMYYEVGYNPCLWPKKTPFSPTAFRSVGCQNESLDAYAHTAVNIDSFVYVPVATPGMVSAKIAVPGVETPKVQPNKNTRYLAGVRNAMDEFLKAGTDPLAEVCKWARENKKEMICCMPLNNLDHNNSDKDEIGMWETYFMSTWKKTHSQCLMGDKSDGDAKKAANKKPLVCGHPLAVDYTKSEVRELYQKTCIAIIDKYDIDGIMLDFTHEPYFFKSVAQGETASAKEAGDLTAMIAAIRGACKAASAKKGHVVLLSVRVPDSIGFCKDIGLDLQGWADQKLFDFIVGGNDFELAPPSEMGGFAKAAGVPYYQSCGVSYIFTGNDSGYPDDDERPGLTRQGPHCFRGRAMNAYQGGASGMLYWNPTRWHRFPMRALVPEKEKIKYENKRYCVTYQSRGNLSRCLKDWQKHVKLPALYSGSPIDLGKAIGKFPINVWDNLPELKKEGKKVPIVRLTTEVSLPSGTDLTVMLNNKALKLRKKRAGSQIFDVPYDLCKYGANEVIVKSTGKNKRGATAKLGNIAIDIIFNPDDGEVAQ